MKIDFKPLVGKKFVKNVVIEVVSIADNGLIVQNEGNSSDQWIVPYKVFFKTYVEKK